MKFLKLSKYVYIVAGVIFSFMVMILIVFSTMKIEKSKSMMLEVKGFNGLALKTDAATASLLPPGKNIVINLNGENVHARIDKIIRGNNFYLLKILGADGKLVLDTSVRVTVIYGETTLLNNLLGL